VLPPLQERFRVIVFDNRGVGQSDVPEGPYLVSTMAADAAAVLDAAGVERGHVLGASMGGYIAQELTIANPQRVRSLILCCTGALGPNAVPAEPKVIETLMARATMTPEEGVRAMEPYIYDANTPRERVEADLALRIRHYPTARGYLGQVNGIMASETESRLGQIDCPTLVIHGETDQLVPPVNGKLLADKIKGAELVLVPNASHILWTDQTEAVNNAIQGFLARQGSALEPAAG
jgi:pimeloyl-ACP methyl ester carboxylesterase